MPIQITADQSAKSQASQFQKGWLIIFLLVLPLFILLLVYLSGRCRQLVVNQPSSSGVCPVFPVDSNEVRQKTFLKGIRTANSFRDSQGNSRKMVVYWDGDIATLNEVYLTDQYFDRQTAIRLVEYGAGSDDYFHYNPYSKPNTWVIEKLGPGDYQDYIIFDVDGRLVTDSVIKQNAEKIGLGTIIRGMYGSRFGRFDGQGDLWLDFVNNDGRFTLKIDVLTGDYVEGSLRQIE